MNTSRIDKIGVATAVDYFCRMGHIDPHINFDDKIPVWDGTIDIHKNADSNSKDDIEFNLFIQVKSSEHTSNNFNASIKQRIDINDIKLYQKKGGTLLIKVLVGKHKSQIYFAFLGKIEINKLLDQITETQKSKEILCHKAPKEFKELIHKLRSIHLQANHNLISVDKLKENTDWEINLSCGPMSSNTSPIDWLATNPTDILVSIPGYSEQFYLDSGPTYIFTEQNINKTLTVDETEYSSTVKFGTNKIGHYIYVKNFLFCQWNDFSNKQKANTIIDIKITPSSSFVDEYLNELCFLDAVYKHKHFYIGDVRFNVPNFSISNKKYSDIKSEIDFFKKTVHFFEKLNINSHFEFTSLTKEDKRKWIFLVQLFNKETPTPVEDIEIPFTCFSIGKLKLCFATSKLSNGGFSLYDINNCSSYRVNEYTNETINFPIHSYLFSNGIFPDNLNYMDIISEYQKCNIDKDKLVLVNYDVLNLINEYDKSKNIILLHAAKKLIEWIISQNNINELSSIYSLNLLQIKFRLGTEFSDKDNQFLYTIQDKNNIIINFASSVLLNDTQRAVYYFNQLKDFEKDDIVQYPIYTLYKNLTNK